MKYGDKEIRIAHKNLCIKRGYPIKIVGDIAYQAKRRYKGRLHLCHLVGSKESGTKMVIYDSKKGYRETIKTENYL